jgi:hypothetical protein
MQKGKLKQVFVSYSFPVGVGVCVMGRTHKQTRVAHHGCSLYAYM